MEYQRNINRERITKYLFHYLDETDRYWCYLVTELTLEFNGRPVFPPPFNVLEILYFQISELITGKKNDANSVHLRKRLLFSLFSVRTAHFLFQNSVKPANFLFFSITLGKLTRLLYTKFFT